MTAVRFSALVYASASASSPCKSCVTLYTLTLSSWSRVALAESIRNFVTLEMKSS